MTDFIDFAIFGIMTGLFSAIGASIAKIYIEPRLIAHKNGIGKRLADMKKVVDDINENKDYTNSRKNKRNN